MTQAAHPHDHTHDHAHPPTAAEQRDEKLRGFGVGCVGHDHGHGHGHHHHGGGEGSQAKVDLKIVACLFGGMLLVAALVLTYGFGMEDQGAIVAAVASILMAAPIFVDAARGLFGDSDHTHMDELIALAIAASFSTGMYIESGVIAFLMLITSFVEHRTAVGALQMIESLIRITPTRASRLTDDGTEHEVDAAQLRPGDVVVVRPGDRVPADGVVFAGQSTLNQANITGESVPVEKSVNDEVFAGTINESGRLEIEITRAGEDSTLGQVQRLILQAASQKPVVARMIEKYAGYYTPTVLMVAAIVFVFTRDMDRTIALLLIACPCAIILAGPTAIVAAVSAAARLGVLIKNVADIEVARRITAIVLDKTGTLTVGRLSVVRLQPAPDADAADVLRLCAAAEQNSKHPVARAVMDVAGKAKLRLPRPTQFEEVAGRGVAATIDGTEVLVGRETWLRERGVDVSTLDTAGTEGQSLIFIARGGQPLGWVGLEDTTRESAKGAMDALAALGVQRRVMITGDRPGPAHRVAAAVDVTDVQAEALPGDKLKLVERLKEKGHTVAVVGDGVNDGPALAAGNVSIAMGAAGSDVAIHSASIALMNNNLDRIPFLVTLSRRTVGVIRQNLVIVVLYILFMLVLLALGWITPLIAAIGHMISSIVVVFNSARLVRQGEDLDQTPAEPRPAAAKAATEGGSHPTPATAVPA